MENLWTKEELGIYIQYQKYNNLLYECVWVNLEDDEVELIKKNLQKQMLKINKPVRIFIDSEYIQTLNYSLINFVKEEIPDKLLTWIPANFKTRQEMLRFLETNFKKESQFN